MRHHVPPTMSYTLCVFLTSISNNYMRNTYDETGHGAQVSRSTSEVQEAHSRTKFQPFHHLSIDTRSGKMNVSVLPRLVFVGVHPLLGEEVVATVHCPENLFHQRILYVVAFHQFFH